MRDVVVAALLVVGVGAQVLGCVGIAAIPTPYDRLHYTGPSVLAGVALAGAVLAREGLSLIADKALMLALVVAITAPVIVQAIARGARTGDRGSLDAAAADVEQVR
jgi:multisubunit Na+/H+ antiporter MnhG subunit